MTSHDDFTDTRRCVVATVRALLKDDLRTARHLPTLVDDAREFADVSIGLLQAVCQLYPVAAASIKAPPPTSDARQAGYVACQLAMLVLRGGAGTQAPRLLETLAYRMATT
ncbi:hypothetical protein ACIBG7_07595 [Nonomuraea sp. NPDC050328]|uniref:hypothetical protein n=1 Tax=Nonomuraea sp. NPDC050328 TaxID=3364361 RepID=UPI0037B78691